MMNIINNQLYHNNWKLITNNRINNTNNNNVYNNSSNLKYNQNIICKVFNRVKSMSIVFLNLKLQKKIW